MKVNVLGFDTEVKFVDEREIGDYLSTYVGEIGIIGNSYFGLYVPEDNVIYIRKGLSKQMKLTTLFHEIFHAAQMITGREASEEESSIYAAAIVTALRNKQVRNLLDES